MCSGARVRVSPSVSYVGRIIARDLVGPPGPTAGPFSRRVFLMDRFFMSRRGPLLAGGLIGVLAVVLVKLGNPGNMGICVACFTRDIAGAVGPSKIGRASCRERV